MLNRGNEQGHRMITMAVILAGGQSRRMGTDKAMLAVGDETLLARTARIVREAGLSPIISGRGVPPKWLLEDCLFAEDEVPGSGPLGGIVSVIEMLKQDFLVVGCDMPLLSSEAVGWLARQAQFSSSPAGCAAAWENRVEPLFACYRQQILPLAKSRLARGERSLMGLIQQAEMNIIEAPSWVGRALMNVNTPQEWLSARPASAITAK